MGSIFLPPHLFLSPLSSRAEMNGPALFHYSSLALPHSRSMFLSLIFFNFLRLFLSFSSFVPSSYFIHHISHGERGERQAFSPSRLWVLSWWEPKQYPDRVEFYARSIFFTVN